MEDDRDGPVCERCMVSFEGTRNVVPERLFYKSELLGSTEAI